MFEWLHSAFQYLSKFVVGVPVYIAGPAMILIGALDSSLLSLPEINDYLVVMRCYSDPKSVFYFPLFAAVGSVIGCLLLYSVARAGGRLVLSQRFRADHVERVEQAYARYGLFVIAIPALLPPPMPFKIFVATAGALRFSRWRFVLTIMIARSLRYYIEGTLAVFYGERVFKSLVGNGKLIVACGAALAVVALAIWLGRLWLFRRRANTQAEVSRQPNPEHPAVESEEPGV